MSTPTHVVDAHRSATETATDALGQGFASFFLWSGPALVFVLALFLTR